MANQDDIMSPQQYCDMQRAAANRQVQIDRAGVDRCIENTMKMVKKQLEKTGPQRLYVFEQTWNRLPRDPAVAAEVARRLRAAGWQVTYGKVNFWNRLFYHYWFKPVDHKIHTQCWWFSLSSPQSPTTPEV